MNKMNGFSADISNANIDQLKALFPDIFSEGKIDFDKFKQVLGEYIDENQERYNFTWNGKGKALRLAQTPSSGTLRPCIEESKDWNTSRNLYIEGDNLEVLKIVQKMYHGKVKLIYIDPPYNTGNDFVYPDDFSDSIENYKKITGQLDDYGKKISTNSESNGRYHTDWLNMMYPRLRLAKSLIADDGAIFISIDDNEQKNLLSLCNEIFGEENYVATFPWRKRTAKSDVPFGISQDYEWVLCYSKTIQFIGCIDGKERKYYETDDLPGRTWRIHDLTKQTSASERPNSFFTMINPKTGREFPANPNRTWAITKDTFDQYYSENRIVFPDDYDFLGITKPAFRYFKDDDEKKAGEFFGYMPVSTKLPDNIGMSLDGTKEISSLFEQKIFSFPKPVSLIKFWIDISTKMSKDSIILDFFSGSATTAHAVMQLNAEDGGNRKFILVQLPELCGEDTEAFKAGYKNICEIGKERIRRAGDRIKEELKEKKSSQASLFENDSPPSDPQKLDIGFKVFKLDSSNLKKWNPDYQNIENSLDDMVNNYVSGRSELDVVYEILLKYGIDLALPVSEHIIAGSRVYSIGAGALVICLDDHVSKALALGIVQLKTEMNPEIMRVVMKDKGFEDDSEKTNVKEILKSVGIEEFVTV